MHIALGVLAQIYAPVPQRSEEGGRDDLLEWRSNIMGLVSVESSVHIVLRLHYTLRIHNVSYFYRE